MKQTLLQIVQSIASDAESDEINDIFESTESLQILNIVEQTFYFLREQLSLPEHKGLYKLEASSVATPVLMTVPSNAITLDWLKYDSRESLSDTYPNFSMVESVTLEEFIERSYALPKEEDLDIDSCNVTINGDVFEIFFRTDKNPSFYSSTNDNTLLFDSYDINIDANLQQSKTIGYGHISPTFVRSNTFVLPIDTDKFPLFIEAAKEAVFNDLKQMENRVTSKRLRDLKVRSQFDKTNIKGNTQYGSYNDGYPNYGRRR